MIAHKDAKGNIVLLPVEDEPSAEEDVTDPKRQHLDAAAAGSPRDHQVIGSCVISCVLTLMTNC